MSKLPSFQFYPGDWASNKNLKRCTHQEKGVWMDVLCLMHDSDEYGVLRWPLEEIAMAVGAPIEVLISLHKKGVLKGKPGNTPKVSFGDGLGASSGLPLVYVPYHAGKKGEPVTLLGDQEGDIWFSSRMVEDHHKRQNRGKQGNKSLGHPNVPRPKIIPTPPKDTIGESNGDTNGAPLGTSSGGSPSSSSSSSPSGIKNISPEDKSSELLASQEGGDSNFELQLQTTAEPFIVLPLIGGEECEIFQPLIDELAKLYPAVDVPQEFRNMRGWLLANAKERKTKSGIARFYTAWLSKNQDRSGSLGGGKGREIGDKLTKGKWSDFEKKDYSKGINPDGSF